jgi:hypothetical protein
LTRTADEALGRESDIEFTTEGAWMDIDTERMLCAITAWGRRLDTILFATNNLNIFFSQRRYYFKFEDENYKTFNTILVHVLQYIFSFPDLDMLMGTRQLARAN